jgi:hypothetical protein
MDLKVGLNLWLLNLKSLRELKTMVQRRNGSWRQRCKEEEVGVMIHAFIPLLIWQMQQNLTSQPNHLHLVQLLLRSSIYTIYPRRITLFTMQNNCRSQSLFYQCIKDKPDLNTITDFFFLEPGGST